MHRSGLPRSTEPTRRCRSRIPGGWRVRGKSGRQLLHYIRYPESTWSVSRRLTRKNGAWTCEVIGRAKMDAGCPAGNVLGHSVSRSSCVIPRTLVVGPWERSMGGGSKCWRTERHVRFAYTPETDTQCIPNLAERVSRVGGQLVPRQAGKIVNVAIAVDAGAHCPKDPYG